MSPASLTQLDSLRVEQSEPIVRQEEEEDEDEVGVHEKRRLDNPHKCYNVIINAGGSTSLKNIDYDGGGGGGEGAGVVSVNCDNIRSSVVLDMGHCIRGDDICDNDLILSEGIGSKGIGNIHRSQLHKATARKALISQCLINAVIMIIVTSGGMPIGFSAILLPQLQSPNSTLPTDDSWASWIASVHSTAAPMGAILAGPIMDQWGRRTTLHLALLPMISGWSFMSLAPNHVFLVVGRLLAGFAVGMIAGPSQVFIGEISEPSLRGLFSSMPSASYALGILLVYAAGSKLHWRFVAGLGTVIPMLAAFALFFVPESPVWLVNKNRPEEAKKCLLLLRGGNVNKVNYELNTLIGHSRMEKDKERQAKLDQEETYCGPIPRWWEIMTRPQVFKPFFIILTFCTLQILSGSYVSIFYGVTLIASASGRSTRDFDCLKNAVMTALVRFVVSIVTSMCLLKLGRRKIGIISGIGTALACFSLVVFLYVKGEATGPDGMSDRDTYIVSGLIMTYVAMNTFGIFSLPGLMIGEVLPSNVRGRVSGVLLMLINLMIFSTTKLYPSVAAILGSIGVFTAFTIVSIIITIFVYLFLPETRDRPLTQIEEYFIQGKNVIWQNRDKDLIKRRRNSLP